MLITSQITFEAFKENFVEILYQSTIERVAGEDNKDDEKNDQCLDIIDVHFVLTPHIKTKI
jgi:hypothetical protein